MSLSTVLPPSIDMNINNFKYKKKKYYLHISYEQIYHDLNE